MKKSKTIIIALAVAALLSVGVAGAALAGGDESELGYPLQTQDTLMDGTGENCDGTCDEEGAMLQTQTETQVTQQVRVRAQGVDDPATATATATQEQQQNRARLQDETGADCDGTCDGAQSQDCDGACDQAGPPADAGEQARAGYNGSADGDCLEGTGHGPAAGVQGGTGAASGDRQQVRDGDCTD